MSTSATVPPSYRSPPGTLHTILLAGTVPLFLGALLSDMAYRDSHQIQWSNFASWLIAGGELFAGLALLFALVDLFRAGPRSGRPRIYVLLLAITWVLGLVNAFEHAKDAWAVMPTGLVLSVVVTMLACVTTWVGLNTHPGATK
jgi:uncharacterized membrane protein